MKLLIIQTRPGIGDMCVFSPAIHEIAKHNKNYKVDIITKKRTCSREIFLEDNQINQIFFLEDLNNSNKQLMELIKKNQYSKVFIFHYGARYPIICKLAGVKKIFFYGIVKKNENIVEKYKQQTRLWLQNQDLKFFYKIKRNRKIKKNNNIVLGIGGSGPTKKWGLDNYINLIKKISSKKKYNYILAGGLFEKSFAKKIIKQFPKIKIKSLCDFNIKKSINIVDGSKIYIGNDTGFMHICAGLDIQSFGLFGDTPANYASYTKRIKPITPVGIKRVGHGSLAINKITPDQVFNTIKKFI